MHLLDLPLEIFRYIIDMYFDSISYMMPCDMKNLQLVNSQHLQHLALRKSNTDKATGFFRQEVARTACNMRHHLALEYCPAHYLERWTFSKYGNNYLGNTIKNVSSQVMKHNRSSDAKTSTIDNQRYRISLLISRAAIDFMTNGLFRVSSVLRREKYIPCNYHPCPSDIDFVTRLDAHRFSQSMRTESGQRGDALEHVLSAAAYLGDISLVGHLLAQGVDVNARSNIFGPPLRNAALRGRLEIVRLLLANGANADDGCLPGTEEGWQVVEGRHRERPSFEKWIPNTTDLPFTAVEAAARNGHKEVLQLLLRPEFRVSRSSYSYLRAITFAAIGGDAEMIHILVETADCSAIPEKSLQDLWYFSLRHAASSGNTKTISLLLDKGAKINRVSSDEDYLESSTPLGRAAFNGHNEAIALLLQRGADINGGRLHPLYLAIKTGFRRTVGLLLDHGVDIESTFLKDAVRYNRTDIVRLFFERGMYEMPDGFNIEECDMRRLGKLLGLYVY